MNKDDTNFNWSKGGIAFNFLIESFWIFGGAPNWKASISPKTH